MAADLIFLHREKILLDTSIYITRYRFGKYEGLFQALIQKSIFFLHSIVFEELLVGANSNKEMEALQSMKKSFIKAKKLVTPSDKDWEETGMLLNKIIRRKELNTKTAVTLTHDVLLALSARRMGIRVVTENRKDFERIYSHRNFKLTIWSPQ